MHLRLVLLLAVSLTCCYSAPSANTTRCCYRGNCGENTVFGNILGYGALLLLIGMCLGMCFITWRDKRRRNTTCQDIVNNPNTSVERVYLQLHFKYAAHSQRLHYVLNDRNNPINTRMASTQWERMTALLGEVKEYKSKCSEFFGRNYYVGPQVPRDNIPTHFEKECAMLEAYAQVIDELSVVIRGRK